MKVPKGPLQGSGDMQRRGENAVLRQEELFAGTAQASAKLELIKV